MGLSLPATALSINYFGLFFTLPQNFVDDWSPIPEWDSRVLFETNGNLLVFFAILASISSSPYTAGGLF